MTMLLLAAVLSLSCGSILADLPPPSSLYVEFQRDILQVEHEVNTNVISMDKNIPLLNDSRRHYAEITHVIHTGAWQKAHSCLLIPYKIFVEAAVPEAVFTPQKVVDAAKQLKVDLDRRTNSIQKLINTIMSLGLNDALSNLLIETVVTSAPTIYNKEKEVHFLAGRAAFEYNQKKNTFNKVSKELDAHKYVINGEKELTNVIDKLTSLYRNLYPYRKC